MKYLNSFENFNESIESSSYSKDKEFIKSMEDSITTILVDMLDDGCDIRYKLTDYAGNIGSINISGSDKTLNDYMELFHTLHDYLISQNYDFHYINYRGWIVKDRDNYAGTSCISFKDKDWNYIEGELMDANIGGRFTGITINVIKI